MTKHTCIEKPNEPCCACGLPYITAPMKVVKPLENHQQLLVRIESLELDRKSLIEHIAVMGVEVTENSDCADSSTESFRALPDHLQKSLNKLRGKFAD